MDPLGLAITEEDQKAYELGLISQANWEQLLAADAQWRNAAEDDYVTKADAREMAVAVRLQYDPGYVDDFDYTFGGKNSNLSTYMAATLAAETLKKYPWIGVAATFIAALSIGEVGESWLEIADVKNQNIDQTPIYRSGSGANVNMTPRPGKDSNGLSYFTYPEKGTKYTVTTVAAVNATGVLIAKPDPANPQHYLVSAINPAEHNAWMNSRSNAETRPYYLTTVLQSISIICSPIK